MINFFTSRSVICLNPSVCFRFGSQIHVQDVLPQYEYWPSNFMITDESVFERPWRMKYCVFVVMMVHTILCLMRETRWMEFLSPSFFSSCRICIAGIPSAVFHGRDTANNDISGKPAALLHYHYVGGGAMIKAGEAPVHCTDPSVRDQPSNTYVIL